MYIRPDYSVHYLQKEEKCTHKLSKASPRGGFQKLKEHERTGPGSRDQAFDDFAEHFQSSRKCCLMT